VAREIAAAIRESPEDGIPGVRALGLALSTGRAQVSTNVHDPIATPLCAVVEAVQEQAAIRGTMVVEAELIGLIPEAALEDYPEDVPIRDFDPTFHIIERRLK
jgi:glutamate formiminotransferase